MDNHSENDESNSERSTRNSMNCSDTAGANSSGDGRLVSDELQLPVLAGHSLPNTTKKADPSKDATNIKAKEQAASNFVNKAAERMEDSRPGTVKGASDGEKLLLDTPDKGSSKEYRMKLRSNPNYISEKGANDPKKLWKAAGQKVMKQNKDMKLQSTQITKNKKLPKSAAVQKSKSKTGGIKVISPEKKSSKRVIGDKKKGIGSKVKGKLPENKSVVSKNTKAVKATATKGKLPENKSVGFKKTKATAGKVINKASNKRKVSGLETSPAKKR